MLYRSNKQAFTMLEMVFVIIIIGIIAAFALPKFERDIRQEAADNVLSAIRYTQQLALTDNKENPTNNNWQTTLWLIRFANINGEWIYQVGSNMNGRNNINQNEAAIDPSNGKLFFDADGVRQENESPNIFLTTNYSINNVTFNNCRNDGPIAVAVNNNRHIAFDYMGRPHRGVLLGGNRDYRTTVTNGNCAITFALSTGDNFTINIARETGYAWIAGQAAS